MVPLKESMEFLCREYRQTMDICDRLAGEDGTELSAPGYGMTLLGRDIETLATRAIITDEPAQEYQVEYLNSLLKKYGFQDNCVDPEKLAKERFDILDLPVEAPEGWGYFLYRMQLQYLALPRWQRVAYMKRIILLLQKVLHCYAAIMHFSVLGGYNDCPTYLECSYMADVLDACCMEFFNTCGFILEWDQDTKKLLDYFDSDDDTVHFWE